MLCVRGHGEAHGRMDKAFFKDEASADHSEVRGSIRGTGCRKMNSWPFSLPCLMFLYSCKPQVNHQVNFETFSWWSCLRLRMLRPGTERPRSSSSPVVCSTPRRNFSCERFRFKTFLINSDLCCQLLLIIAQYRCLVDFKFSFGQLTLYTYLCMPLFICLYRVFKKFVHRF